MSQQTAKPFPYRPLGLVKTFLDRIGLEITYAYEDLIFVQHNPVLLQFGKEGQVLFFYRNVETPEEEAQQLLRSIQTAASEQGFVLIDRGRYRLSEGGEQSLALEFLSQENNS